MGMSTGSMSTYNPMQQLYQLSTIANMSPYVKDTYGTIGKLGQGDPQSAYNPVDFNKFVKQSYVDPIQYQMDQDVKGLQHSNERFSMGRKVREMQTREAANSKMQQLIGQTMGQYRSGAVQGLEKAYGNKMSALGLMNNAMAGPLAQPGQENMQSQQDLLSSIFG